MEDTVVKSIKFVDLHCTVSGSDKVYHCMIGEETGGYAVNFAYGRRGTALSYGSKTQSPVSLEKAEKIYDKLVAEKTSKGYVLAPGISGDVFGIQALGSGSSTPDVPVIKQQKESSGVLPQLLNPCTEDELEIYLKSDDWGCQEKYDGDRRLILVRDSKAQGINRKGQFVQLMPKTVEAALLPGIDMILDGEAIGETLFAFGILECDGENLRGLPYFKSYMRLQEVLSPYPHEGIQVIPLALTTEEKKALFDKVKAEGGEGVVFKRLGAPYNMGRPNKGGDQLKYKNWESASCLVIGINDKRSVQLGLYDADKLINVGNVTIPPNKDIPQKGTVVEIRYLYAYKGGSLFQPQYEGERTDIDPSDCDTAQLKYTA